MNWYFAYKYKMISEYETKIFIKPMKKKRKSGTMKLE